MVRTSTDLTIACVLHVPDQGACDYDADYVARLQRGVARHLPLPHRFVCLSNVEVPCERIPLAHGWGHWWAKMEIFRPDLDVGRMLYLDLDTVPVGDLSEIAAQRTLTMLADFNVPTWLQSGVMMLQQSDRPAVWQQWTACPDVHMKRQGGHGDGGFIRAVYGHRPQRWQEILPGQVVSFKNHAQPIGAVPPGARLVAFHGRPRPHDLPPGHFIRRHWQ